MWNSRNEIATLIVLAAHRKYTGAIVAGISGFHLDGERSEELDEVIRLTRTMRSASSLIGSYALSRVATLIEEMLEAISNQEYSLDDDALSVLLLILDAIDAYTLRFESRIEQSSPLTGDDQQPLVDAIKTYRRFRDLPEEGDDQAIAGLLSTPAAFADAEGVDFQRAGGRNQSTSGKNEPAGARGGAAGSAPAEGTTHEALAADFFRQEEIPPELLEVFQEEARDHIDRIYAALRQLEGHPGDRELVQEVRRSAHTLKGAAGAVGLRGVTQLSHRMEDLLDAIYAGSRALNSELLNLLAATTDTLHDLFTGEEDAGEDPDTRHRKLCDLYAAYDAHCGTAGTGQTPADTSDEPTPRVSEPPSSGTKPATCDKQGNGSSSGRITTSTHSRQPGFVRVPTGRLEELRSVVNELIVTRTATQQGIARFGRCVAGLQPVLDMLNDVCRDMESLREAGGIRNPAGAGEQVWDTDESQPADGNDCVTDFDELEFDRYTNFDLWSQALAEAASSIGALRHELATLVDECDALFAQQSRLTLETQDRLFRIQMVALSTIMPRLRRALREVATREGKAVELIVEGEDVELDKTVLEEMVEPLLHLLRNAVDHGVEPAEQRAQKGKPAVASVRISLANVGTQVVLRVGDDGQGLNAEKIRASAIERGCLDPDTAASLTPQDLYRYIFLPGFSTASSISEISGRGVGMDVVHSKIEQLQGRIDVESIPDQGTCFTIRLPVRLAVTRALLLTVDDELYALPQKAVHSIIKAAKEDVESGGRTPSIRIDGVERPLIRLREHLGFESSEELWPDTVLIAVIDTGAQRVALQVDGILPGRDIVVKPVANHIATAAGLLGATILANGAVVPILDPTDLVAGADSNAFAVTVPVPDRVATSQAASIMIVDDSVSVRSVLQSVVKHAGWSPVAARDGLDALEILATLCRPPDIFLLDVEMPRMDGFELLRVLRQNEMFAQTPVIMITSRAGDKHRQQALSLGASEYVTKPFQHDALIQTIRQHLERPSVAHHSPAIS